MSSWEYLKLTAEHTSSGYTTWSAEPETGEAPARNTPAMEVLNELGEQGWELVSQRRWDSHPGWVTVAEYLLKRELP